MWHCGDCSGRGRLRADASGGQAFELAGRELLAGQLGEVLVVTPRRIIAPVTLAHDSLEATVVAAELAAALGAELLVVGIVPPAAPVAPDQNGTDVRRLLEQVDQQRLLDRIMSERLEELTAALPEGMRSRTLLTSGPVGPALVDAARELQADLVVLPIRREGELAHLVHDHAERYVLHHSYVPVLVVPTLR
jgi:nucleotide-binding universal stress UspA family protein